MWFQGAINQALDKSKNEKLMLFTFIKGTNEHSIKMNDILDTDDFKNSLNDKLVALRFDENSNDCKMFKQIYPFDQVPTIYLISSKATVFEKIVGSIEKDDLVNKVNSALDKQKQLRDDQESQTSSLKRANESPAKVDHQSSSDSKDKEIRAQDLLKDLRVKKQKEEEQRERDLEKERIRTGKELQTAREIQRQKEMEEIVKQREREKLEEKRHREKVLAQIKQDQEDRKARQAGQQAVKPKPLVISQPTQINSDQTRIQFRLPDSTTMKNVFNCNDTLRTVIRYIEDNTPHRQFKLATNFPVKEFGDGDLDKSLIELKLAPSASLIVKKPPVQQPVDPFYSDY